MRVQINIDLTGQIMGGWAGGTDPLPLANIKFKIAEGADLTEAATSIRIESSETAAGYNFYGQDLNLGEEPVVEEEPVTEEPVAEEPPEEEPENHLAEEPVAEET